MTAPLEPNADDASTDRMDRSTSSWTAEESKSDRLRAPIIVDTVGAYSSHFLGMLK